MQIKAICCVKHALCIWHPNSMLFLEAFQGVMGLKLMVAYSSL